MADDLEDIDMDLSIDKFALDVEWQKQPVRFKIASDHLVDAKKTLRELEAQQELIDSGLYLDIRRSPKVFDLDDKPTEAAIKNTINTNKKHVVMAERIRAAQHKVDRLSIFMSALDQRRRALSDLVSLFGSEYFSIPARGTSPAGKAKMDAVKTRELRQRGQRRLDDRSEGFAQ